MSETTDATFPAVEEEQKTKTAPPTDSQDSAAKELVESLSATAETLHKELALHGEGNLKLKRAAGKVLEASNWLKQALKEDFS